MTLIIIIAAILIERFWHGIKDHYHKNYFSLAAETLLDIVPDKVKNNQWLFLLVLLIVPFIVVYIIHLILLNILGGLPALLFDITLLLLCVRSKPDDDQINAFIVAQQDGDEEKVAETFYSITDYHLKTVERPNSFVTRVLFLQSCRHWFGVIFYFVLLGPAGLVLYRSLQSFVNHEEMLVLQRRLRPILAYLEWPLSRLLALTFFLSGSFDDALKGWREQHDYLHKGDRLIEGNALEQSNQLVLLSTGCAAISHDSDDDRHNDTAYVQAAQGMLSRSLIIWCAVIAVMTLTMDIFI